MKEDGPAEAIATGVPWSRQEAATRLQGCPPRLGRTAAVELAARTTWVYDQTYQLTREQRSGTAPFAVTYVYDPAGNRTLQVDSGTRTTSTYDAANQLLVERTGAARTSYTYDLCGNRTEKNAAGISSFTSSFGLAVTNAAGN